MSHSENDTNSPMEQRFQLLMARPEDLRAVLDEGLPLESVWNAPKPKSLPGRIEIPTLESFDGDPNDLSLQRWGVIAPCDEELYNSLLKAIAPLVEHREQEQGTKVKVYRVRPDMDGAAAVAWRDNVLHEEAVHPSERPRFLLILGDVHHVSLEFQQVLAQRAYVGRVHVSRPDGSPDLKGYEAYTKKLLTWETSTEREANPDVLFFTARDTSSPIQQGEQILMKPCRQAMEARRKRQPGLEVLDVPQGDTVLDALSHVAGQTQAGVMLSLTHGLGRPAQGWSSVDEQHARQGALLLGKGELLTGERLREGAFLAGGVWFCVSCFGAATPVRSDFLPWLQDLSKAGAWAGSATSVLRHLAGQGERPFLAALPQALLANEKGPLAFMGHSDLAWPYSYMNENYPWRDNTHLRSRASRIQSAMETLVNGSRVGVAHAALMQAFQMVNDRLMENYNQMRNALLANIPNPVNPALHARLWMTRNDLRGYLLLGDPAARLPLNGKTR